MAAEDDEALAPGDVVAARYAVRGRIGEGGMGVVYEAVHVALDRPVALKVIPSAFAADDEAVQRFFREARAAASLGHPGIVQVFDVGQEARPGGAPVTYLAMERLEGEELAARLEREGPLPVATAVALVAEAAEALSVAHDRGIVHRDLKPQNLFLARVGPREVVKVLDFGIAKLAASDRADGPLTLPGQVFGTPAYMSPEQIRGEADVDGRSDVYALGVVLHELLTGRPPFEAASFGALAVAVTQEAPRPLRALRPDAPAALEALVAAALAKRREDRPAGALALAEALRALLPSAPTARFSAAPTVRREADTRATVTEGGAAQGHAAALHARPRPAWATRAVLASAIALAVAAAVGAALTAGRGAGAGAPRAAQVRFTSEPPGVEVRVDAHGLVCVTPCALALPPERLDAVGRLPGHHARTEPLAPPFPPTVHFTLPRRAR